MLVLVMLSRPLPCLYRHRFSHRVKWPAFQIRRLQRLCIPKKQKDRKLQNFIVSCSYSKRAVGRYLSLHVLGKCKGTYWLCSSSGYWGKTRWLSWAAACQPLCPCFLCAADGCGVLWGGYPAQVWSAWSLILCFIFLFHSFVSSLLDKLRTSVGFHQLSFN